MQNQPARPFSVAAFNATRQANPEGVPADGLRQSIQAVANWLTARGMNDPVQPGELKKIAALHRSAAQMHQRAGQDEAAKAHQVAAEKWEKGVGTSISAAADTQMAKLINYQDGGIVDGIGRDQLKAANDGINAAKNATPANLRHLYKSGIRSDRNGSIWSWVLKEFPRKGAGLSTGRPPIPKVGDRVFVAGIGEGEVTQKYAGKIEVMFVGANVGKWFMEYDKRIRPAGAASLGISNGASTMQTATAKPAGMSRKAAYLSRIAASQGGVAAAMKSTAKVIPIQGTEYFGVQLRNGKLAPKMLPNKFPNADAAFQYAKRQYNSMYWNVLPWNQEKNPVAESSISAARTPADEAMIDNNRQLWQNLRNYLYPMTPDELKREHQAAVSKGDQKRAALIKIYAAEDGLKLAAGASVAAAAPPFAKKPEAQSPAQPAPQAPAAPPAPEPDPADAPLGMSRKAKFVRRMLAKGGGGAAPAAQAAIAAAVTKKMDHAAYQRGLKAKTPDELKYIIKDAREAMQAMPDGPNAGYYQDEIHYAQMELKKRQGAGASMASDPASRGMQSAKRENNGAISQRIKRVLGNDPGAVKQAIGVYTQAGPQELLNWLKENYGQSVVDEMRRAGVGASIAAAAGGNASKQLWVFPDHEKAFGFFRVAEQAGMKPLFRERGGNSIVFESSDPNLLRAAATWAARYGGGPNVKPRMSMAQGGAISAAASPPANQGFRDNGSPVWVVVSVQTGQAVSKPVTREMAEKIKTRLASTGGTYDIKRGSPYGASISAAGDGSNSGTVREAGELYQFLSSTQSRLQSLDFVSPEVASAKKKVAETISRLTAQADTLRHSLAKKMMGR